MAHLVARENLSASEATETLCVSATATESRPRRHTEAVKKKQPTNERTRTPLLILYMFSRHAKRHKSFLRMRRKRVQDKVKEKRGRENGLDSECAVREEEQLTEKKQSATANGT